MSGGGYKALLSNTKWEALSIVEVEGITLMTVVAFRIRLCVYRPLAATTVKALDSRHGAGGIKRKTLAPLVTNAIYIYILTECNRTEPRCGFCILQNPTVRWGLLLYELHRRLISRKPEGAPASALQQRYKLTNGMYFI